MKIWYWKKIILKKRASGELKIHIQNKVHFFCKRFLILITPRAVTPITAAIKNPKIIANTTMPTALSKALNKLTIAFTRSILINPDFNLKLPSYYCTGIINNQMEVFS